MLYEVGILALKKQQKRKCIHGMHSVKDQEVLSLNSIQRVLKASCIAFLHSITLVVNSTVSWNTSVFYKLLQSSFGIFFDLTGSSQIVSFG